MDDIVMVLVTAVFFLATYGLLLACDRLMGERK
jgi:hypothetical protein